MLIAELIRNPSPWLEHQYREKECTDDDIDQDECNMTSLCESYLKRGVKAL